MPANHDAVLNQILHGHSAASTSNSEWSPYNTKTMCILDIIDNFPRTRISDSLMKIIIWAMKECGVQDTPSFYALRKTQENIRKTQGVPSVECKSVQGKIFYLNDPRTIISHDWANPSIRKHIHIYPEIPEDGIVREVWHAEKWRKDMDPNVLSPMYDAGNGRHYYVCELARMKDGSFIIPVRWVISKGTVCADAFSVQIGSDVTGENFTYMQLSLLNISIDSSTATGYPSKMPNPYRKVAGGDPLYTSFVDFFGDDVSGNRSKSWNKHNNTYLTHRNLPRKLLQQEFHIHLISTSQHATISEQYCDVKKIIDDTHKNPVRVEDESGHTTKFMIQTHAEPSDNPAQSDVAAHIGAKGNYPCCKCHAGGSEIEKSSDEGFHAMFLPGNARNTCEIKAELEAQVQLACRGVVSPIEQRQTDSGTKDAYTQYWIDYLINRHKEIKASDPSLTKDEIQRQLLDWVKVNTDKIYSGFLMTEGFDPTKDTPIEILHTILLGIVKYIWHYSHSKWKPDQKQLYSQRLQATDTHGLSINSIRANYIINYANSLVGRQFKTIIQTAVFHLHDLVDDTHFKAWKAVGQLSALLWHVQIDNMDEYCNDIAVAVANVQDTFALIDPTKIIRKIKIHLLAHLPEDIRAFGPLLGVITESFESFNAVFRFCSVLSNHLAPSRDISRQTADQESMKHRLTGGRWKDLNTGEWTSAGTSLQNFLQSQPILQTMLGWSDHKSEKPGSVVSIPAGKKDSRIPAEKEDSRPRVVTLDETNAKKAVNRHSFDGTATWIRCKSVVAASSDSCPIGSWVFCRLPVKEITVIGRIDEILASENKNIVILEEFEVASSRDTFFDLPYIFRRQDEVSFVIVPSQDLLFIQNVQHDCRTAKCSATGVRNLKQERKASDMTESFIQHKPNDRFLINLNAFHNAHLVRQVLPRELTSPIPLYIDRRSHHDKIADGLRENLGQKKKETQKKREETQQKKRKAAAGQEQEMGRPQEPTQNQPIQPKARPKKRARKDKGS
ncbi:hypothetical protein K435DRAFT_700534 [Dendrothele bispora CBS 962.96]|uniref:Uncharacterized protein n=1 Tax=Dendrothele bispora (strain CBS 962.96) TaxID=1314807 RepID=A0A4S8KRC5_DENBC|nr:hypothetical protein K435DRAFT_700534 [Dendrothele bispora CBS 962.96]